MSDLKVIVSAAVPKDRAFLISPDLKRTLDAYERAAFHYPPSMCIISDDAFKTVPSISEIYENLARRLALSVAPPYRRRTACGAYVELLGQPDRCMRCDGRRLDHPVQRLLDNLKEKTMSAPNRRQIGYAARYIPLNSLAGATTNYFTGKYGSIWTAAPTPGNGVFATVAELLAAIAKVGSEAGQYHFAPWSSPASMIRYEIVKVFETVVPKPDHFGGRVTIAGHSRYLGPFGTTVSDVEHATHFTQTEHVWHALHTYAVLENIGTASMDVIKLASGTDTQLSFEVVAA